MFRFGFGSLLLRGRGFLCRLFGLWLRLRRSLRFRRRFRFCRRLLRLRLRSSFRLWRWFGFRSRSLLLFGLGGRRLFRRRLFGLRFGRWRSLGLRLWFRGGRGFGFRRLLFRFGRCRLLLASSAVFSGFAFGAFSLRKYEGSV